VNIAILGANGFIGRNLAQRLAGRRDGRLVLAGRRLDPVFFDRHCAAAERHETDFADTAAYVRLCRDVDCIVHLVAGSTPRQGGGDAAQDYEENLVRHIAFFDALRREAKPHVIFISSGGTVYGPPERLPIGEDHPTRPISDYGICKLAVELYLQAQQRIDGLPYTILRLANPFGPGQRYRRGHGLIPLLADCARSGHAFKLIGDGSMTRDFIYIDDVTQAIALATGHPGAVNAVFNIGSGRGRSVAQVIAAVERRTARRIALNRELAVTPDVPVNVLDVSRAARQLGWNPQTDFETGLALTLDSYQAETGPR
jgi:UDP-glucose 4-epimerase